MTDLDAKAAAIAALPPEDRERIAYVENIRAILRLPAMQAGDKTRVRRAIFVEWPVDTPVRVVGVWQIVAGDGVRVDLGLERQDLLMFGPSDPLPEWWTALVPA